MTPSPASEKIMQTEKEMALLILIPGPRPEQSHSFRPCPRIGGRGRRDGTGGSRSCTRRSGT